MKPKLPRAPLPRQTGGAHRTRRNEPARKAKHRQVDRDDDTVECSNCYRDITVWNIEDLDDEDRKNILCADCAEERDQALFDAHIDRLLDERWERDIY